MLGVAWVSFSMVAFVRQYINSLRRSLHSMRDANYYADTRRKTSLSYSYPKTLGAFFRELFAVTLLLTLQERAWAYDFFTPGLVLFLILITCRVPYINSYAFIFEFLGLGEWRIVNHVGGVQKHEDFTQNLFHGVFVLLAHILGAIAAAALRVYFDVTFGKEVMSASPGLSPALEVNVDGLRRFDSFWNTGPRLTRLAQEIPPIYNGTIEETIPLHAGRDLGIDRMALVAWYVTEEIGYTCLLCVCYIHIWIGTGVVTDKRGPVNPFKQEYWKRLFKMCLLLTLIYMSLYRAFPTAHGSLHMSIYRCQYQAWNPNVYVYDSDNSEIFARIVGGLFGVGLAIVYNKMLVGTEKEEGDWYYRLIWGLDPDATHVRQVHRPTWDCADAAVDGCAEVVTTTYCSGPGCLDQKCVCRSQLVSRKPQLKLPTTMAHPK